jgi:hypothetical protein
MSMLPASGLQRPLDAAELADTHTHVYEPTHSVGAFSIQLAVHM